MIYLIQPGEWMSAEFIETNGIRVPVKIYFEKRKTARASIGKKAVYIRIPAWFSHPEKVDHIKKLTDWARETVKKNPDRFRPRTAKTYRDNDLIKIRGRQYRLRIEYTNNKGSSGKITGSTIRLRISSYLNQEEEDRHISALISRLVAAERLPWLKAKIKALNSKFFRQNINKISFKHNKHTWGSCSGKGNINISTRLLFAPDEVLVYVCLHELAHLIERNHSGRFWALVEKAMPNHREMRRWLKENDELCWF